METINISVAKNFTIAPGPRYISEGSYSGEAFRNTILEPAFLEAIEKQKTLTIDLDGTFGYGTSFLEECFGGLARIYDSARILKILIIVSQEEPYLIDDITKYITEAKE